jgi:hypothetical protein
VTLRERIETEFLDGYVYSGQPDRAQQLAFRCARIAMEAAARTCDCMVIGGRAWNHDQQVAAEALLAAAKNIRHLLSELDPAEPSK